TFGEDGKLQGLLEMCGFPYVGATVGGSFLGMDKDISKKIWTDFGIDVVPHIAVKSYEYKDNKQKEINNEIIEKFGFPLFIKPAMTGSSVGVTKVYNREKLTAAILKGFSFDTKILAEPAITGREIECSVTGNIELESYPPGEAAPTHDFYDYNAKYIDPEGAGLIIPADLSEKQSETLRNIAEKAYSALELRGFARVDFFLEADSGRFLLNEVNTLPGFTNISMFPKMCEAGGLHYPELLDRIIELAEQQFEISKSIN
ncbi:MAG: D-alanine--D-alanine ligase, partial [Proteobacteria bacterium]|nr:D-alanine--D-alanine ligase [Pseudomonadota bacterium]